MGVNMKNFKFKRFIVIVCLFTFLFLPISGKIEEPKAEVLTSTAILWALGELAVVLGCVAVSAPMLEDMGSRILDSFENMGGKISDLVEFNKIKITSNLLMAITKAINLFPKSSIMKPTYDYVMSKSYTTVTGVKSTKILEYFDITGLTSFSVNGRVISTNDVDNYCALAYSPYKPLFYTDYAYYIILYKNGVELTKATIDGVNAGSTFVCNFNLELPILENIPYSPDTTKGYTDDKPIQTFPGVSSGTHDGYWDIPNDDYYVNEGGTSFPLESENVKDKVVETPIDGVIEGDGTISKPDIGDIDAPTTGDGLWDTLIGWLKTLFAPLISLLGWIGDILNSILSFLSSLVIPTVWGSLDWSPLYFSVADKFPFCIPFDMIRMIKEFQYEEKEPVFDVDMSSFSSNSYSRGQVGFTIDLTKFDELIQIVKTLTLISFIFFIAFKTRDIIKG